MKTYDKYKSSGIDWIGDIPEHWEFVSLRRITEEHRQGYYTTREYVTEGVKLIRITDLDENGNISHETMPFVEISEKDEEIFQVQYGDFLFPRTGSIGLLGLVKDLERAVFASYLINFRFKKHLSPNFLKFYFFSDTFKSGIISDLHGGVNQNIHAENIKNQFIAIPTFSEQTAIADYLDEKTAQIDKLIAEKRCLIELLKEERLGVINQAVTRGINPHAKLKPSGIAWLGDMPEHWVVVSIGYRFEVQLGKMLDEKRITGKHLAPYLRNTDVQWQKINTIDLPLMDFSEDDREKFSLKNGDLLVCEGGEVGRSAIWKEEISDCFYQKALHRLRPLNREKDSTEFLFQLMLVASARGLFTATSNSNIIQHLPAEKLRKHQFPFPPLEEQKQIVEFIETAIGKIDATIATIEKEIGFLGEYRTALISEVVTGKIKVI